MLVSWASFFVTLQDILLLSLLGVSFYVYRDVKFSFSRELLILLFFMLVPVLWSVDPVLHMLWVLRFFLLILVVSFAVSHHLFSWKLIFRYFLASMGFISCIALFQIFLQSSVGFSFLGEPFLSPEILGVAKIDVGTEKFIRPYGVFAHPNILAYFLGIAFFFAREIRLKYLQWFFFAMLCLTFSRAVLVALAIPFFIQASRKEKFIALACFVSVFLVFWSQWITRFSVWNSALFERLSGIWESVKLIVCFPIGSGWGSFVNAVFPYSSKSFFWEMQPVHNVFLLMGSELGVLFLGVFLLFVWNLYTRLSGWRKNILLFSGIVSLFDHFLFTSVPAFVFFFFLFFLFFFELERNEQV